MSSVYTHYNNRYNNQTYRRFTYLLANEGAGRSSEEDLSLFANCLTDAALEICGEKAYAGATRRLAVLLAGTAWVTYQSAEAAFSHLCNFDLPEQRRAHQLLEIFTVLREAEKAEHYIGLVREELQDATGTRARAAHDLTEAALVLMRVAQSVLTDGDPFYIAEKLRSVKNALLSGVQELSSVDMTHDAAMLRVGLAEVGDE